MGAEVISITVLLFFSVFWEKIELCIFDQKRAMMIMLSYVLILQLKKLRP